MVGLQKAVLYKFYYSKIEIRRQIFIKSFRYWGSMPAKLPDLGTIVDSVVGDYLARRDYPQRLSTEEVRQQLHATVHERYFQPERKEPLPKGRIKGEVRRCLEKYYRKVEESVDNPLNPGGTMVIGAYYEKKND